MKKYVGVYMASQEKLEEWNKVPKDEAAAGMEEWKRWAEEHKSDIVELGAPLGKNKRVSNTGVSDVSNEVCGYTIVQADSHDAAAAIFAENPHVKEDGAWIDVLEMMEMPG